MSKDNDLYGDDIRLWSEAQSALLRRLSAGEAVADQIDWPHVVEAIEHSQGGPEHQEEIARLTARLSAAAALVKELRSRLDDPRHCQWAWEFVLAHAPPGRGAQLTSRPAPAPPWGSVPHALVKRTRTFR